MDQEECQHDTEMNSRDEVAHNSMVTVRLSEPELTIDIKAGQEALEEIDGQGISADCTEVNATYDSPVITMRDPNGNETRSPSGSESSEPRDGESRRGSDSSEDSHSVNWEELEKTEEQEPRDQVSDDVGLFPFLV